jgi:hypothetical protein
LSGAKTQEITLQADSGKNVIVFEYAANKYKVEFGANG